MRRSLTGHRRALTRRASPLDHTRGWQLQSTRRTFKILKSAWSRYLPSRARLHDMGTPHDGYGPTLARPWARKAPYPSPLQPCGQQSFDTVSVLSFGWSLSHGQAARTPMWRTRPRQRLRTLWNTFSLCTMGSAGGGAAETTRFAFAVRKTNRPLASQAGATYTPRECEASGSSRVYVCTAASLDAGGGRVTLYAADEPLWTAWRGNRWPGGGRHLLCLLSEASLAKWWASLYVPFVLV